MSNQNLNPWFNIWVHPKKTIRSILDKNPRGIIPWIAIIWGISLFWNSYLWKGHLWEGRFPHAVFFIALVIAGAILGIVLLYFEGWIYNLTSSWIGGKGDFTKTKCVVGWSKYPFIITNIFGIISVLVLAQPWVSGLFGFLNLVAAVWGFVLFMNMLGEAQKFSAWKGVLAFLIAFVLIFVAIMIIALLVPLLSPLFQ